MARCRILIVEDEAINALFLKKVLAVNYDIIGIATSGEDAIRVALNQRPDCIIMDIKLEGELSGIEAIRNIQSCFPVNHIYCTAYSEESLIREAKATNPLSVLLKPLVMEDLLTALNKVTECRD